MAENVLDGVTLSVDPSSPCTEVDLQLGPQSFPLVKFIPCRTAFGLSVGCLGNDRFQLQGGEYIRNEGRLWRAWKATGQPLQTNTKFHMDIKLGYQ